MIIGGSRVCGKTTELIKIASKEDLYIVCADKRRVEFVVKMARELGCKIPFPITVDELPLRSGFIKNVLVDDVEAVLYRVIGKNVNVMTSSREFKELTIIK